ncbi:tetratricopeptide repeat protein [Chryseobacterium gwangjuense]|uniref:tetratricopeptide repeat protein n=1 Tax=Chryseobacterium gwangjuense TaxID=1069980 RepID=UPI001E3014C6|nr:tetratricopeptide repeat protein [Chryseobacterium gwangjuense]MCE3076492.1 tetratricopeptide repeat protein [Chryseobacterium gwangjuense]
MKFILKTLSFLLLSFYVSINAQRIPDDSLMKKAHAEIYDNPDNAIQIGKNLLKKDNNIDTSIKIYMLLSTANIAKRNFDESLKYILKAKELSQKTSDPKNQLSVLISVAIQYQQMELFSKSLETLNEADLYLAKIPENSPEKYIETARSYAIRGMIYKSQSNSEIALEKFLTSLQNFEKVPLQKTTYSNVSVVYYNIGYCYLNLNQIDKAQQAFLQSINYAQKNHAKSLEAFALKGMAEMYKQKREHQTAINLLQKAENLSKNTGDIVLNEGIYKEMADNYLALRRQDLYQLYNKKYFEMRFKRKENELISINQVIDNHNKETSVKSKEIKSYYSNLMIIATIVGGMMITLLLYLILKMKKLNDRHQKNIQHIIRAS